MVLRSVFVLRVVLAVCVALCGGRFVRADELALVRYVPLWKNSTVRSPDTAGVAYHSAAGRLLIADSEVSEYGTAKAADAAPIFSGQNLFVTDLPMQHVSQRMLAAPEGQLPTEPVGITYNPQDGGLYITDDDTKKIYRFDWQLGEPLESPVAEINTSASGQYTDPEGITCDPQHGDLYVVSGTKEERVLRYRYRAETQQFEFAGEFSVAAHLHDPEGIAWNPQSRTLFLIAGEGIAEFAPTGEFVQKFDYAFLEPHGVQLRLPGGGTFAPSSDPHDAPSNLSLYVSCRGIDNGQFPQRDSLDGAIAELQLQRHPRYVSAADLREAVHVPRDCSTVQAAIDRLPDGGTILLSPGVYREQITISGGPIRLVSEFVRDGDTAKIEQTVIDGNAGDAVVAIAENARPGSQLIGLTIRNGDDGIAPHQPLDLLHCHVTECTDGIDYEGGGGLIRHCRFWKNRDDAIDLDGATAAVIEQCELLDSADDGIEIRLEPYSGPTLQIVIRGNVIRNSGEDGIQLIGYAEPTSREIRIERNLIVDSVQAGIGMMDNANTREDLQGAALPELALVHHNTLVRNAVHVSGGGNVVCAGNLFVDAGEAAVRNLPAPSQIVGNLFWANARDADRAELVDAVQADPQLDESLRATAERAVQDRGRAVLDHRGKPVRLLPPSEFTGAHPDLGHRELSRDR